MKIGLTNGCFDLFHEGHFHYLASCKEHCDYLIVALNSDNSVTRLKGRDRPRQTWVTRCMAVMESGLVEAIIPFEERWQMLAIEMRPDVIFQGAEYRPLAFDVVPIIYIERLPGFSTSLQIQSAAAKTNA